MATLVTGGCGFVGLAVTEVLLAAGEVVTILDTAALPQAACTRFGRLPGTLRLVQADVRDLTAVKTAMAGSNRLVIAAAVTCGPAREMNAPEQIVSVNVGAVATAVRAAAEAGLRRIVHLSSVAVYGAGPDTEGVLAEDRPCRPQGLYGITKLAGEATALRLAELFGLDLVVARLGACFGPWEHDTGLRDTLSPHHQIMALVRRGESVRLDHDATRDWLYIRDAAAAIAALLGSEALSHDIYNIGPGRCFALSAWSTAIGYAGACVTSANPNVRSWGARPPAAIGRLVADTGLHPRYSMDEAAADWLRFQDDVDYVTLCGQGSRAES